MRGRARSNKALRTALDRSGDFMSARDLRKYRLATGPGGAEAQLQRSCVEWFNSVPGYARQGYVLFSSLNGAQLVGGGRQWNKLKKEGARPGVADLFLSVPSGEYHGLYIEMKTPRGRQSKDQQQFEREVLNLGYGYAMPRSFPEFKRVVSSYLERGAY